MNNKILREIQMDIRNNFGKTVNWDTIPKGNFNCFMFAISNTVPTEILDYEEKGINYLRSLVGENVPYFGDIGQISGKTNYTTITELIEALKCDLETLGIFMENCSSETIVSDQYVKIAFFYNIEDLVIGKHSHFHFIKQDGNVWKHKSGWTGNIEQIEVPIDTISFTDLKLIGYFKLSLKNSFR